MHEQCRMLQPHFKIHDSGCMCFKSSKLVHEADVECSHIVDSSQISEAPVGTDHNLRLKANRIWALAHEMKGAHFAVHTKCHGLVEAFCPRLVVLQTLQHERMQLITMTELSADSKASMHAFHQILNAWDYVLKWPFISHPRICINAGIEA